MGCFPTPKPDFDKIIIVYEPLYPVTMPDFVTDEPPYGWEKEPPKPSAYLVHGEMTLENNEMILTLTSKPRLPRTNLDFKNSEDLKSKYSAPAYAIKRIDQKICSLVERAIQKQEHNKRPIFFSAAKANVALSENVKTLEVILKK